MINQLKCKPTPKQETKSKSTTFEINNQ